ncbi:MAG: UDP-glucose/GDP-mannose dehydrogenase family protein [Eubacteriales bacterium]|nr:UDP-glucose/GDP-mannose dehydrogenase family protein [Eubacteriales bacterium]
MKLAVAGTGYVGLVAGVCFAERGHLVTCVDVDEEKVARMRAGESPIYEVGLEELLKKNIAENRLFFTTDYERAYSDAEAIFIGVGTPEQPDGSANLSYIAAVCRQIAQSVTRDCLVVVKSTVPVGTNDKVEQYIKDNLVRDVTIRVASNPEFLAQSNAVHDMLHAARIIIGTDDEEAERQLLEIYAPFDLPVVSVSRRSAEMIKYACNNFLALKISFMNDMANLCELVGANIDDVAEGMRYDPRIGAKFLKAGVGYGGSCFPKDTKALTYLARQNGVTLKTVDAAVEINAAQRTRLFEKAKKRLMTFEDMKVAVLGLAFKPGTDDLREAPSLENVRLLLEHGANLVCYDPVAGENFHKKYPDVPLAKSVEEALEGAFCCFIFTEWDEFVRLSPEMFRRKMRVPLVYDGRNIFDPDNMKRGGVEYYSIGR